MARVRTVDFLPEIFQTSTNRQFLSATLDQLVQEPKFKKIQGFVGRKVGPGVNANENYVAETDKTRADYQLEPGVILKDPNETTKIIDAITYPGIIDALTLQGADTTNADRLFTSDYYTWDPFIDFDKFVNFSQYYWLPAGPDSVDVFAETVPTTDNFVVTRENGVYTFSGTSGNNPLLTLVRGGNYTFQVAQNKKETVNYRVTNQSNSAFVIDYQPDPTLTLVRGNTYVFDLSEQGIYSFYIKTENTLGTINLYNSGVTNNGARNGKITFVVPQNAPDVLYYNNDLESNMSGVINIVDATPGTGPGFWIQTDPGISGRIPSTPNISSRDVLGVENNGEDLGTVTFNVPLSTAQSFYYGLTPVPNIDLIVDNFDFDQINNQFVAPFLAQTGGIDGIESLDGKTLIFTKPTFTVEQGGWEYTSQFDPLLPGNNGLLGSYDTTLYDQTLPVPQDDWYSVWQIRYQSTDDGQSYIRLVKVRDINKFEKFSILYGDQFSSTGWYKNAEGFFEQIPLLTAVKDVLFYQDGTDPEIFGRFKLIDQDQTNTLDIDEIVGRKNYTSPNGVVFTNGMKVQFIGAVIPESYQNKEYYIEGVGTAIKLLPVTDFVTPETYTKSATVPYDSTGYDIGNFDASLNQPLIPDYLTINRASADLNPWTRSNRWFHIDVINATAEYNNTVAILDNNFRAKRPILEFRAGTKLFDFGTQGKQPVNIIDFQSTDALSNINGTIGYSTDGYNFIDGSRVIFANDTDPQVRNKIYVVQFITPDTVPPLIAEPIINLVPASDADILIDQTVVCLSGAVQQGKSFYYDGVEWLSAQSKTSVNQAPLFNVYDIDGISFGNRIKYPSTNFRGNKLFSYKVGIGQVDAVLGFPLSYLSLANVGDIVFENNLYTDTFVYTKDSISTTENVSTGTVREYLDRVLYKKEIGWQPAVTKSISRQQFKFIYNGDTLQLDVKVNQDLEVPGIHIYVGSQFQEPNTYTVETTDNSTTITLNKVYVPGDVIEVDVISDQTSKFGFYEVPVNLENNPLNQNSPQFTLGTVRSHYETIAQNLKDISGPINGANNIRDLGNVIPYGTNILQQSSPMTLAGYFMRSNEYNIFEALDYNSREYEKFKAQMLDVSVRGDYTNYTIPEMLTAVINYMNSGRTESNPFYWSDMLPASSIYQELVTTITPISTNVFDLTTTYDFTSSNFKSVLVYVNDVLLQRGYEYVVATDGPRLTITVALAVGDVVRIQEYATTYGTFVPNTPTKLGLYAAWRPEIYIDTTYVVPTPVIRGHDGSITVAFGDFRDQLLLEFETRIFNNLKINSAIPLSATDVIPGQFRTTDYSTVEINQILAPDFLTWVGWNKLNYQQQDFNPNNEFTWNYSAAGNKLTGTGNSLTEKPLPAGAWRGIYRYFYDTDYPDTRPWEMLGFSEQPAWWTDIYGPAPYTDDNLVLWDDLAQGRVADPDGEYFLTQYARPRLQEVIPTGSEGELLSPLDSVVGLYDSSQFQKSWAFGDGGPVEATWFKSSSYPYAIMRLLALTRPAEFFSLFADRDLYKFNSDYNQYLYNNRYRLDANGVEVYGLQSNDTALSKASYINWIVDYNQQLGRNATVELTKDLKNLDVRLCYRVGSFTDKQYLKIYTEKSSPNSLNSSLLLPDESYNLLLYKNQPFDRVVYSSVIIQQVQDGYAVFGYSITNPYFEILASRTSGTRITIDAGGSTVRVPNQYSQDVVQVPYGYVFTNQTVVVDFLLSYGALLERQGLVFDNRENGRTLNWNQMAQEFLYWANQGWNIGSVINLNPSATTFTAIREQAIVDSVIAQTPENLILDQNRTTLPVRDLVVDRYENVFSISSLSSQTISYLDARYTNYESIVILDNVSIFNDLIYDPVTGSRQSRINVSATVSAEWNGQLDAQGFILNNQETIEDWQSDRKYAKGEIVNYKNNYWSAQTIVQPSAEFEYANWVKSDYTKIERGLLQNISNKANQLANSYNTNDANLETDSDLLSYGLIGFRPRQYMTALNLDDVSQVNLYQQFLKDKGTIRSVRLLGNANLGKEVAEYDIFENWAVQRATYGANANRSFVEIQLNEALLRSDPALVQIVEPLQQSEADQTVDYSQLWRQSYKIPNANVFPTTLTTATDTALPSAGYVNLDDVDLTVFSLLGDLQIPPNVLETVGIGTTVWAAKSNSYDWNIYRCSGIPGNVQEIVSNLNTTSTVRFSKAHGLNPGDIIIIRFFDQRVDGVHRVLAVPNQNTVLIDFTTQGSIAGQGVAYFLQTMRVAQASDAVNLPYVNELVPGARIWVDNNGQDRWTVIEKQSPFSSTDSLTPTTPIVNSSYGASVAQGYNNVIALVGAPDYINVTPVPYNNAASYVVNNYVTYQDLVYRCIANTSGNLPTNTTYWSVGKPGAVYPYLRDTSGSYIESAVFQLEATGTAGYGNMVNIGNNVWAIAGAGKSNNNQGYACVLFRAEDNNAFEQRQLLLSPDEIFGTEEFGYSGSISFDERWMYVGAPGDNKVHAYARIEIPTQIIRYTTSATEKIYSFDGTIEIDQDEQIIVSYNNKLLVLGTDYTVTSTAVVLTSFPPAGQQLLITRKTGQQLDYGVYYNLAPDSATGSGVEAKFTISRTRGVYTATVDASGSGYAPGDTVTFLGTTIGGGATPANDLVITVDTIGTGGSIETFTPAGAGVGTGTTFDVQQYLYTADNIFSFSVLVNGSLQRPYIDYTYDGTDITFLTVPPVGAQIVATAKSYFKYVDTLTVAGLDNDARFGQSVSTTTDGRQVLIGSSLDDVQGALNTVSISGNPTPGAASYINLGQSSTSGRGYGAIFKVIAQAGVYSVTISNNGQDYQVGDTITIPGTSLGGTSPANDAIITVSTVQEINTAGNVYAFDRAVIRYIVDNTSQTEFDIPAGSKNPVAVLLNNEFLTDTEYYVNGQYTVDLVGNTVTLSTGVELQVGDILEIEVNIFNQLQKMSAGSPSQGSNFGQAIDVCPTNCSLYLAAPNDSLILESAGSVDRRINQSRLYGTTTSINTAAITVAAGDTIRINNTEITFTAPLNWSSSSTYVAGNVVNSGGIFYVALRSVPAGTALSDTSYWVVTGWIDQIVNNINDADIPNIQASKTPVYNGTTLSYYRLTVSVIDLQASDSFNRLTVLPGTNNSAFDKIGFNTYAYAQTITSPYPVVGANFGASLFIDSEADNLVVGAPRGSTYEPVTFDGGKTFFDDRSTIYSSVRIQSGAVYTFDFLPSADSSVNNPGNFIFGQQIYDNNVKSLDQWGASVSYVTGKLLVGSPGSDVSDSTLSELNYGRVGLFNNATQSPAWTTIHTQQPVVDVYLLNSVYMFDKLLSSKTHFFDFINPLQGKILGAARQNIDYIGSVDPAKYNTGAVNNNGNFWAANRVGEIWWDTNSVRFIDPNQDDLVYASRRWGQTFPGSQIEVYQWIESTVPPAEYTGVGVPYSLSSYTVNSRLTVDGTFATLYYFWVKDIETIATQQGKTLSTTGIARYIEAPRSSGIPYIAALNASTVAIYNGLDFISAQDTIFHVEYDREYTTDNIHVEYELIAKDRPDSFLSTGLYRKLQDSFCGTNETGALVPDPMLAPAEQYGVQFRPRQSMFANRFKALENYLTRANNILKDFPIVETRRLSLLNSSEPEPTVASGEWNKRVATYEELSYQNLNEVPLGYKYLVVSDSTNNGLWTIYTVINSQQSLLGAPRTLLLTRVQTYDTRKYWYHIDWYQPGYNNSVIPVAEVPNYSALETLTISTPIGSSVKVTANAQGKFEIYLRTDIGWDRVGLQDGTLQFSNVLWDYQAGRYGFDVEVFDAQYFDQSPVIETRKVIQAINEELFVDELAIERNRSLMLMFDYVLTEFQAPEWLVKTSLIDVEHRIRELVPFQIYRQDNQEFVLDYLQEVKPYHVQIREFNLAYNGADEYPGLTTDFDIPAYYDTSLLIPQYVSPILLPYTKSDAVGTGRPNDNSDVASNAKIWQENPWTFWFNNYLLSVQGVNIIDGGIGYTVEPEVVVTGTCVRPAEMTSVINSAGQVVGVNIVDPGEGYSTTAVITFVGGNGAGARASSIMGNDLIRHFKTTIKYDRYQYTSDIQEWQANQNYDNGTQVRYLDQVWQANSSDSTGVQSATFDPQQWLRVSSASLSGVDRTQGFYVPDVNEPGLSLPLLIDGLDYPGVQVYGPDFNQNSGFDVGNYDINPFDNIAFGPEGLPTYDPGILDAIYESYYGTPVTGPIPTGNAATDVNVDGGEYVDTYSSHAPEELIPGSEFDTLDLRVYTRPGADWAVNGHGFDLYSNNFTVTSLPFTYDFSLWYEQVPYLVSGSLANQSTGDELLAGTNFTVNWGNRTFTITSGVNIGDVLTGTAYGLGGGNQLYRQVYAGNTIVGNSITIPVTYSQIQELAIFVNGQYLPVDLNDSTENYTYAASSNNTTVVTFTNTYTSADLITLTAIGPTTINGNTVAYSWSTPQTQYITGQTGVLEYALTNSLEYSNPVNLIVSVNGARARTASGIEYYADGSSAYLLPTRLGFSQSLIADNEVFVYIDDIPQVLGVDYTVDPFTTENDRAVSFATAPTLGERILIAVTTKTQCYVNSGNIVFDPTQGIIPNNGDIITVTTWNDTRQQNLLTKVWVGPTTTGFLVTEGFDQTAFDPNFIESTNTVTFSAAEMNKGVTYTISTLGTTDFTLFGAASNTIGVTFTANWTGSRPTNGTGTVTALVYVRDTSTDSLNFEPGAFDYSEGVVISVNDLQLGRAIVDPARLWVTLNGNRLFNGVDFTINGEELVLSSGLLNTLDVVMVTEYTDSTVPESMAFRIFQDMRGNQLTYRITTDTTTSLTATLSATDDIIYVENARALGAPELSTNIWGILTINGERIMYREIDYVNNIVSGLRRGTAGTAAANHSAGAIVYDLGLGNLMPMEFQNYVNKNTILADGIETLFTAPDVVVGYDDSALADEAVEVYVGGIRQLSGWTMVSIDPVAIDFTVAPIAGVEVTILVRRGVNWYQSTGLTPSDGVALQDTNTKAARFLRGL
jgi:hypothetical protein